jgi:hypothetical protein
MGIAHLDMLPLLYGITIFFGLYSMWRKLCTYQLGKFFVELGVFTLVFSLHGGTMTGGFAATIAALLAGMFFFRRRKS